ncbi:MAG: ABC transporter permease [Zavarzinia sp.]|nr:ABC transporter permease [Zavarzinia sp.]
MTGVRAALLFLLIAGGGAIAMLTGGMADSAFGYALSLLALTALAWRGLSLLANAPVAGRGARLADLAVPVIFGLWIVFLWQAITIGYGVPQVLLPSPGLILARLATSGDVLLDDFRQTFLKAVLAGYVMGCGSGFLVAVIADRVPFLRRGLLPLGNLASALPIVGVAPIMVMWFGFDWPSKAAVVVIMTFFPMLVNTVAGLAAAGAQERELLRTYAATNGQALLALRLPAAMPFVFNALKINSTLALIGAIVAEFFGTPIVGMGFRISTEVGRMNLDMVWAEIVVAAVAGSAFYGLVALAERRITFWHPSYRQRH